MLNACNMSIVYRSSVDVSRLGPDKFRPLLRNDKQFQLFTLLPGGDITSLQGRMSRFNPSAPPILEATDTRKSHLLSVANTEGDARAESLRTQLGRLRDEIRELEESQASANKQQQSLQQQCQQVRHDRAKCQQDMKQVSVLKRELESAQRHLADIVRQLSMSAEAERAALKASMRQSVQQYQDALDALNKKMRAGLGFVVNHTVSSKRAREIRTMHMNVANSLRQAREGLHDYERAKRDAEMTRDVQNKKLDELNAMLNELQQDCGGPNKFSKLYRRCTRECPEETFAEIEIRRQEVTDIIQNSIDNPQLLDNYERTKDQLAVEEASLVELQVILESSFEKFEKRVEDWTSKVSSLAIKLNSLFESFMSELKYHGSVELRKVGGLDTYEMIMQVSFRDVGDIAPLSAQRHSGGERAVSTIMYLMALQGLTSAPFRVVDEINQGMDERNERLVFDIIVRHSCISSEEKALKATARKPQYFLVSPKLLQGLKAMESRGVTVLMVWNGPGALPIHMDKIISKMRREKRIRGGGDADEEDGDADGSEHKDGHEISGAKRAR
jgi:chromosome segregation ATPase